MNKSNFSKIPPIPPIPKNPPPAYDRNDDFNDGYENTQYTLPRQQHTKSEDVQTVDLNTSGSDDGDNGYNKTLGDQPFKDYSFKKTIDICDIFTQVLIVMGYGLFTFCLFHYYINMTYNSSSTVVHSDSSNLILTEIVMLFIRIIMSYTTLIIKLDHFGETFSEEQYEYRMSFRSYWYGALKTVAFVILHICTMALAPMFIPFNENKCHGYETHLCDLSRIIAFFGIIMIIMYGVAVVIIAIMTITQKSRHRCYQ